MLQNWSDVRYFELSLRCYLLAYIEVLWFEMYHRVIPNQMAFPFTTKLIAQTALILILMFKKSNQIQWLNKTFKVKAMSYLYLVIVVDTRSNINLWVTKMAIFFIKQWS